MRREQWIWNEAQRVGKKRCPDVLPVIKIVIIKLWFTSSPGPPDQIHAPPSLHMATLIISRYTATQITDYKFAEIVHFLI